ncbi:alpha/beta fold hydrolase [Nonlabens sp. Ci31]|jgi:homoserine O-acetyltransferase|uniref:alpha/beta fold hydrolase n=1 Tax=Nonlabens sp. Ci31 TaxID=2608253 RepID=UPI00146438AF|nr:alpha/beta fold hydrolase [Nonlabens sp. Ci31]QJP34225.1 alpha/beta fold hydrolase [Nonlabens sp. Ci31]
MALNLKHIDLLDFKLKSGKVQDISVSYQVFGRALHTAPIILINHALTGNSSVTDWWGDLIGDKKVIDTLQFTVLAFDIPGNGYDGNIDHLIFNYQDWTLFDVGFAFAKALQSLNISFIDLGIGGSIGGALLWEMLAQQPELFGTIVPIAADWKATDWIIACCHIQESILATSSKPVEVARQHAMTFYRSPQGLRYKFKRSKDHTAFKVQEWLDFHGVELKKRFSLPAYRLLNQLLCTANAANHRDENIVATIAPSQTAIELVAIDTDGFFVADEDRRTYGLLKEERDVNYHEISSIHGHDAFLIEHDQVKEILCEVLQNRLSKTSKTICNNISSLQSA